MDKGLSVCLIVKNEERNLPKCLESVKKIADEIIVVDTGSEDSSKEIAKKYGAKVFDYIWDGDFSKARNKSIEMATKEWLLFLDGDEIIEEKEGEKLKGLLEQQYEGIYFKVVNVIDEKEVGDFVAFRACKNKDEYKFNGKIHEQIIQAVERKAGISSIARTDIKIKHYGYDPKVVNQKEKNNRNLKLLLNYEEENKDGYYYYVLGNEYKKNQQIKEALECYEKAMKIKVDLDKVEIPTYYSYLAIELIDLLYKEKYYKRAIDYISYFKIYCKNFKELYFKEALIFAERCEFSKAKKALLQYINYSQSSESYNYPNNYYDILELRKVINRLDIATVPHRNKLITAIVLYDKENDILLDTIRSLKEITEEVFLLVQYGVDIDRLDEVLNLDIKLIKGKSNEASVGKAIKKAKGEFILFLESDEILSNITQQGLVKVLEESIKDFFMLSIVDLENQLKNKEIRVFRNTKDLQKIKNIKKMKMKKGILETFLYIHKFN